ncbi:MAG TPA: diguanylate cyclase [Geopsychrobacteraceae bacterium]|nr:diguanylate cyclase [Geopsychrobacteraceae bacterium]
MWGYFTVTRKVAIGYLLIVLFSMAAIGYALLNLYDHTKRTEDLVGSQFEVFVLLRDLSQNLLAQEKLEKQLLILNESEFLELLELRNNDFEKLSGKVRSTLPSAIQDRITIALRDYSIDAAQLLKAFEQRDWTHAEEISSQLTSPLRSRLVDVLSDVRVQHQRIVDQNLRQLSEESSEAYRLTLLISLAGIILSAPVALTVISSIQRSVRALQRATHEIAAGSFDSQLDIKGSDEFGLLALDFASMGHKLRELEILRLDANPLTSLPGNLAIDREIERRIHNNIPFAHLYIDLDNFKAYGDRYGYQSGSDVIARVAELIQETVETEGAADDMVGHIGGDDYVILTRPDRAEPLSEQLVRRFDQMVPEFYSEEDRKKGFFIGKDRYGVERQFPLLTISIAILHSENFEHPSLLGFSRESAHMKAHLKHLDGSNYLVDRRKQFS